ncbi:MAG: ABC transporter ATP-binding protein, partial [Candidatus Omnitrophica bacterium]|nr:ABC transporter ATP-binding protein [Candidatus Omnitrophota bacterium]
MVTIKTENLTRKFGVLTALDQLNLEVQEGEIFGLVGPDGAGKTTTMRLLTGILNPTEGQAWTCNKHTVKEAESLKEHIAYMSQRFGLYEELSVLENINFYADVYGVARDKRLEAIERLLGFSGLLPFKQRFAGKL